MIINQELKALIPPLAPDEYAQLEANILKDGCRDPLVLWGDTLVDGHNRYEICTANNIEYKTVNHSFESLNEVKEWMITNQFGRRNLNNFVRAELALKLKPVLAEKAKVNQSLSGGDKVSDRAVSQNSVKAVTAPIDTQKEIAKAAQVSHDTIARTEKILATATPEVIEAVRSGKSSINEAYQEIKKTEKAQKLEEKKQEIIEQTAKAVKDNRPVVYFQSFTDFLEGIDDRSQSLLITDPPYSTDVDDINAFASEWVYLALDKVADNGRAYICIGAYPNELMAYLSVLSKQSRFIVDNPIIWTYRNTLGITPKRKYNLNYQVVLHLYTDTSPDLDTSITNEMFSVQDINAPDGRIGDRYHAWQKPDELARRLITHSTKEGDTVIDPFCCTGTFPLMAAKLGRIAKGCDISYENLSIAKSRGCNVIY